ncbi:MAG TPA: HAMP domain-containing sensor histidine kinase [Thermoanaerobaculia bacterium]|nr:HAMP domain-containing sensor histidine kinase [Thermoanaerobaculia bacterium]
MNRRPSILWLIPAVLIPLGVLVVMQYRFLRTLESKTASAEQNWLRNALEDVVWEIENQYRVAATKALTLHEPTLANVSSLSAHFAANRVPGARGYFAVRYRAHWAEIGYFDAMGRERMGSDEDAETVKMATASWVVANKIGRSLPQPSLHVDERDAHSRVILRPVTDANARVVGVVGVILDPALAKIAMTQIGKQALKRHRTVDLVTLLIAERFPRRGGRGGDYFTLPLSFVFSDWRAGVRDACASPEEIAARAFRINMIWTGSVLLVLFGAIALATQAVVRQSKLSQMKSDFVSNVSHELRTPLASIRVFGEYMRLGRVTKSEKIQQYGEYIEAESRRLTQLINNILDFSKIESAEKKYHFAETDVVDLVAEIVAAFEVPLRERGFTLRLDAPVPHPPLLRVDKDALSQVFVNLLDNAVKYSNGEKDIDVVVTTSAREMRIAVSDRGMGIAPAEQKKIFEKFYRVGSGLVHDVKGSGLGLAIVKHVVCAHGGRVELESTVGKGSTFTIVLPLPQVTTVPMQTTEFA